MIMEKYVEAMGKNVQEAVDNALRELGVTLDKVNVEILSQGGVFKNAKVRVQLNEKEVADVKNEEETECVAKSEEISLDAEVENIKTSENAFQTYAGAFLQRTLQDYKGGIKVLERAQNKVYVLNIEGEGSERFANKDVVNALQVLLNAIEREHNKTNEKRIIVNVGDYEQKRCEMLYKEATRCADQAIAEGRTIRMNPMNSYERHLIHDYLQSRPEIIAESFGVDPYRYLTIRPNDK